MVLTGLATALGAGLFPIVYGGAAETLPPDLAALPQRVAHGLHRDPPGGAHRAARGRRHLPPARPEGRPAAPDVVRPPHRLTSPHRPHPPQPPEPPPRPSRPRPGPCPVLSPPRRSPPITPSRTHALRAAAILWVVWGAVHVLAAFLIIPVDPATAIGNIADAVDPATLAGDYPAALSGILSQHGWNLRLRSAPPRSSGPGSSGAAA